MAMLLRHSLFLLAFHDYPHAAANDWNASLVRKGLWLLTQSGIERENYNMEVHGTFPAWLSGTHYRNGPGRFEVNAGGQFVNALFDGYALVHGFKVDGATNSALYTAKYMHSPRYDSLVRRGDMSYQGKIMLGSTPPRKENHMNVFNLGGEVSVNFIHLGNGDAANGSTHMLAVGELPFGIELDQETLDTIKGADQGAFFKYDDDLSELGVGCAHPVALPNGDLISKTTTIPIDRFGARTDYNIFRIAAGSTKRELLATYSQYGLDITYAHSFALPSQQYAVLPFWPVQMNKEVVLTHDDLVDSMQWRPTSGTKMTVLNLATKHATTYLCNETFFGFHFVNSWVDNSTGRAELVADIVTEPDNGIFSHLMLQSFRNGSALDHMGIDGTLKRMRIPMWSETTQEVPTWSAPAYGRKNQAERFASERATLTTLSSIQIEAPRINDAFLMNGKYKFVYGWHATRTGNHPNAIAKIDVSSGSHVLWIEKGDEFGVMMGEPVFVPAPTSKAEDDGVVVTSGLHIHSGRAFVLVLNAVTMEEIARAYADVHITFGFHSKFVQSAAQANKPASEMFV